MKRKFREWSVRDCQVAAAMYSEATNEYGEHERFLYLIAKKIDRSEEGVRGRLRKFGRNFGEDDAFERKQRKHRKNGRNAVNHQAETKMIIPAAVLADRDRRHQQLERASTTALLCGDPPPGYSALDRRPHRRPLSGEENV